MSKNKNQLARFRRIHELLTLRKGTVVKPDEFCRACDISRRTLDNDIAGTNTHTNTNAAAAAAK